MDIQEDDNPNGILGDLSSDEGGEDSLNRDSISTTSQKNTEIGSNAETDTNGIADSNNSDLAALTDAVVDITIESDLETGENSGTDTYISPSASTNSEQEPDSDVALPVAGDSDTTTIDEDEVSETGSGTETIGTFSSDTSLENTENGIEDAGVDSGIDSEQETESVVDTDSEEDTGVLTDTIGYSDTDSQTGGDFPTNSDTNTGVATDTEVYSGDTDTASNSDIASEYETDTALQTEIATDTGVPVGTDTTAVDTDTTLSTDTAHPTDTSPGPDTDTDWIALFGTVAQPGMVTCDMESELTCDLTSGDICCLGQDWVGQNNCVPPADCPAEGTSGPQDAFHTCDNADDCSEDMYCIFMSYYPEVKTYCDTQPRYEYHVLMRTVCDPRLNDCPDGQICTPRRFKAGSFADEDVGMYTCERPACPEPFECMHQTVCEPLGGVYGSHYGCGDSSNVCCELP